MPVGDRFKGPDGTIYQDLGGGQYMTVAASPPPFTTKYADPLERTIKTQQVQKGANELQMTPDVQAKQKAEAQKAQIEAKTAQELYDAAHPQVGTPAGMTGPAFHDYLAKTNPARLSYLVALIEGRQALTPQMARTPAGQAILQQVSQLDPTFDATNFATRAAERKNAAVGRLGQSDNALITTVGHLARLHTLVPEVFGTPVTPFNSIANYFDKKYFSGGQTGYEQNQQLAGNELAAAYNAKTEGKQEQGGAQFDEDYSTGQKEKNITGAVDLLMSKLAANRAQFAYGNGAATKPDFMLLPPGVREQVMSIPGGKDIAAKYFAGIPAMGDGSAPPSGGGTPPNGPNLTPATGGTKTIVSQTPADQRIASMLASGTPSANIRAYAKANNFPIGKVDSALAWRAINPGYKGGYDVHDEKIVPTTVMNRMAASPLGAGALAAADAGTAGLVDEGTGAINTLSNGGSLSDNIAAADMNKQMLMNANPKSALAGNILGGASAMLGGGMAVKGLSAPRFAQWLAANPIKAAAAGDMLYGGAYGAGENNDNRALGGAVGAPAGLAGSFAGAGASRLLGGALRGVVNPAVDRLRAAGIPLTVGETLGGGWKKAQDAMTNVLGPGGMVARRYNEGRRALNETAFNQAGDIVDTPINAVGQQGVQALDAAKSQAYSQALDPISLNLDNPQFVQAMKGALDTADAIPGAELPEGYGGVSIRHYVGNQVAPDGTMTGAGFQNAYRGLAQTASKAAPKIEGHDIGDAIGQAKGALTGALQDQNPGAYEGFLKANSANRHLNVLANAVEAAKNQVNDAGEQLFTPAQLGTAASANATKYGSKIGSASGERPFNQLALDAQQVMSSKIPDSGTQARLMAMGLATGAATGGGGIGYGANGGEGAVEGAAIPLTALTLLGTRRGQQLLTAALLKRVAPFRTAGTVMGNRANVGGDILAAAGIPLLAGQ